MPYVLLAVAIIGEVFGTACMKLSDGFKNKLPVIGLVIGYLVAFGLIGIAVVDIPLGVAYGIWAGAGTALTALVGALVWKEGLGWKKVAGIALIIVGVVLLEIGLN
jgi:multidrug transporter EmrE-like cation transporter